MPKTTLSMHAVGSLITEVDGFIAANRATTPQEMLAAFRSLEAYPYKNADHSPRYFTTEDIVKEASGALDAEKYSKRIGELEAAFKAAKQAFDLVSKPTLDETDPQIQRAQEVRDALGKLVISQILLTTEELEAIRNKKFDAIDLRYLTDDAQVTRSHIGTTIDTVNSIGSDGRLSNGVRFTGHYDAELLAQVEDALAIDSTAKMLLEHANNKHLPIVFAEYDLDKATLGKMQIGMGYMASPQYQGRTFHFITAFKNLVHEASVHAITIAHELRHFRFKSLFKNAELDNLEPHDQIIALLLDEADAQAVFRKVAWSMRNKNLPVGIYDHPASELAHYFNKPLYRDLPLPRRLQRATQDCFAAFIFKELTQPVYIKKYVDGYVGQGLRFGTWMRQADTSTLLTEAFLTRLSKVTENVSYLDTEGMKSVREMIVLKLPEVVQRLEKEAIAAKEARDAKTQKPEP